VAKKKQKYYVVWIGAQPGIYKSWDKCKAQIQGYPGAKYKSFGSEAEAHQAFSQGAVRHEVRYSIEGLMSGEPITSASF